MTKPQLIEEYRKSLIAYREYNLNDPNSFLDFLVKAFEKGLEDYKN